MIITVISVSTHGQLGNDDVASVPNVSPYSLKYSPISFSSSISISVDDGTYKRNWPGYLNCVADVCLPLSVKERRHVVLFRRCINAYKWRCMKLKKLRL